MGFVEWEALATFGPAASADRSLGGCAAVTQGAYAPRSPV